MPIRMQVPYDRTVIDFFEVRTQTYNSFYGLGGKNLKWLSGRSTPKNWLGYNETNPSPGYDIDRHYYEVLDEHDALILKLLGGQEDEA